MTRFMFLLVACLGPGVALAADAMPSRAASLVAALHLRPIPVEGGWFAQDWRATLMLAGAILPKRYHGVPHPLATVITVLETRDGFSAFHELPTDEIWHYADGDPIRLHLLEPGGTARTVTLDRAHPIAVVPAGDWQASEPDGPLGWSLGGTTMAPGFVPEDFIPGDRAMLIRAYPGSAGVIARMTREVMR